MMSIPSAPLVARERELLAVLDENPAYFPATRELFELYAFGDMLPAAERAMLRSFLRGTSEVRDPTEKQTRMTEDALLRPDHQREVCSALASIWMRRGQVQRVLDLYAETVRVVGMRIVSSPDASQIFDELRIDAAWLHLEHGQPEVAAELMTVGDRAEDMAAQFPMQVADAYTLKVATGPKPQAPTPGARPENLAVVFYTTQHVRHSGLAALLDVPPGLKVYWLYDGDTIDPAEPTEGEPEGLSWFSSGNRSNDELRDMFDRCPAPLVVFCDRPPRHRLPAFERISAQILFGFSLLSCPPPMLTIPWGGGGPDTAAAAAGYETSPSPWVVAIPETDAAMHHPAFRAAVAAALKDAPVVLAAPSEAVARLYRQAGLHHVEDSSTLDTRPVRMILDTWPVRSWRAASLSRAWQVRLLGADTLHEVRGMLAKLAGGEPESAIVPEPPRPQISMLEFYSALAEWGAAGTRTSAPAPSPHSPHAPSLRSASAHSGPRPGSFAQSTPVAAAPGPDVSQESVPRELMTVIAAVRELGAVLIRGRAVIGSVRPLDNPVADERWTLIIASADLLAQRGDLADGTYLLCCHEGWRALSPFVPPQRRIYTPFLEMDEISRECCITHGPMGESRFVNPLGEDTYPTMPFPVLALARHRDDRDVILLPDLQLIRDGHDAAAKRVHQRASVPTAQRRRAAAKTLRRTEPAHAWADFFEALLDPEVAPVVQQDGWEGWLDTQTRPGVHTLRGRDSPDAAERVAAAGVELARSILALRQTILSGGAQGAGVGAAAAASASARVGAAPVEPVYVSRREPIPYGEDNDEEEATMADADSAVKLMQDSLGRATCRGRAETEPPPKPVLVVASPEVMTGLGKYIVSAAKTDRMRLAFADAEAMSHLGRFGITGDVLPQDAPETHDAILRSALRRPWGGNVICGEGLLHALIWACADYNALDSPHGFVLRPSSRHFVYMIQPEHAQMAFDEAVKAGKPFVLVTHNGEGATQDSARTRKILDHPLLIRWFACSPNLAHPKLQALPRGLANSGSAHGDRSALVSVARACAREGLRGRGTGTFSEREAEAALAERGAFPDHLRRLASRRYCICPGRGDSTLFWQAVYLGVIPVVVRSTWSQHWRGVVPLVEVPALSQADQVIRELQQAEANGGGRSDGARSSSSRRYKKGKKRAGRGQEEVGGAPSGAPQGPSGEAAAKELVMSEAKEGTVPQLDALDIDTPLLRLSYWIDSIIDAARSVT